MPAACAVRVPREAPLEKLCGLACGVSTGLGAAMVRAEQFPASAGDQCRDCDFHSICPIQGAGSVTAR